MIEAYPQKPEKSNIVSISFRLLRNDNTSPVVSLMTTGLET